MSKIPLGAKLIGFREARTQLLRLEDVGDGWAQKREYATRTGLIEVWIDIDELIRTHGEKALQNRNKESVLAGGAIVLKARGCRDTPL